MGGAKQQSETACVGGACEGEIFVGVKGDGEVQRCVLKVVWSEGEAKWWKAKISVVPARSSVRSGVVCGRCKKPIQGPKRR